MNETLEKPSVVSDKSECACSVPHPCNCGTVPMPHNVGENGCVRRMTKSPVKTEDGNWIVDDAIITDYTLRYQRGYHQHECGCWSWWNDSVNSLDA